MIQEKLKLIEAELEAIKSHKQNITKLSYELNKFNPFNRGEKLKGNGYTHREKPFLVDRTFVAPVNSKVWRLNSERVPLYFIAAGMMLKKNGEKGANEVWYTVLISDVINKDNKQ